ncbi:MAG TPA: hypothetical protein PK702_05840 [Burkholderiaceae bacterium]|nr:hypothetical protein [Burkholderiaceae bacterium]
MKIQSMFITLAVAVGATLSGVAFAQTATPVVDQKTANQQQRINQGVASGELTRGEAIKLQRRQNKLAANTQRAKADGVVTDAERRQLNRQADRNSKKIYNKKHNRRDTNPR